MKRNRCLLWGILMGLAIAFVFAGGYKTATAAAFKDLNQNELIEDMGAGWNLGNQLEASTDAGQGETLWGNPVITPEALDAVKAAGFNTVRIPVSWLDMIGAAPDYKINTAWLNRVQEVVDYAIENDMYVLLDVHNDGSISVNGSWILTNAQDQATIKNKLGKVWGQIAKRFADYDEHLIFEAMNEIGAESSSSEEEIRGAISKIEEYNQVFVNAVRQAGGNNDKRWLMVPGWLTNIDYTAGDYGFEMPTDTYLSSSVPSGEKRMIVSVHYYTPWEFCGEEDGNITQWGDDAENTLTWANESYMNSQFKKMYDGFITKGYPVVIGEYGVVDKSQHDAANLESRAYYMASVCKYAKQYNLVPVYWDNGNNGNYGMALFDRWDNYKITQPKLLGAVMHYYGQGTNTTVSLNKSSVKMELGDTPTALQAQLQPSDAGDWIEWISSNTAVAKVDRYGKVYSTGIGSATITAKTNGGTAQCQVTVTAPKACRIKLYYQNSHNWLTQGSDAFAEVTGDGNYSVTLKGSRDELYNITQLYLQDLAKNLGAVDSSLLSSASVRITGVSLNGNSCAVNGDTITYSDSGDGFYISLINVWGGSLITNLASSGGDGCHFTNVSYSEENTLKVDFRISNAVMNQTSSSDNQVIYQGGSSYEASDASWLMNASANDVIQIKYYCTETSHAGWGVANWGAMVDGEWVNGPAYSANAQDAQSVVTANVTAGQLRDALGIGSNSAVTYLSLSCYNGGMIESISLLQ